MSGLAKDEETIQAGSAQGNDTGSESKEEVFSSFPVSCFGFSGVGKREEISSINVKEEMKK